MDRALQPRKTDRVHSPSLDPGLRSQTVLRTVHRWLGLTLGVLFAAAGVSGSLLIFQPQFFNWVHGALIPEGLGQTPGAIDEWVRNARAAVPDLKGPIVVWPPHVDHNVSDAGMLLFTGRERSGFGNTGFAAVLVAPETGKVLGVFDIDRSPAYAPVFFHARLWGGTIGGIVVGVMGLAALGLMLIGLFFWLTRSGTVLGKLSPRPWRGTFLHAARLHQWAGIWVLPFLLVLAGTGVFLSQSAWVSPVLDLLVGPHLEIELAQSEGNSSATGKACDREIGFDDALGQARALVPNGHFASISPHAAATPGKWLIVMQQGSDALFRGTHLIADLACGTVVVKDSPETRRPRLTTELWLGSLHDGTAFGTTGRIVATLLGLIPLLLAWSGVRVWWRGRRMQR